MTDAFVSYAREDLIFVERVTGDLEVRKLAIWVDLKGILVGEPYWPEICAAIERADNFIFVVSPSSAASEHCRREVEHAVLHGKRILPVLHQEVPASELPPPIAGRQWFFFRGDFAEAIGNLEAAIRTDPVHVRMHTRLLARALDWEARSGDESTCLRGDDLRGAEAWLVAITVEEPRPTPLQVRYVLASRQAVARRRRRLGAAMAVAGITVAGLAVSAWYQKDRRDQEARRNIAARLAVQSQAVQDFYPERSLLLAIEANRVALRRGEQALPAAQQALRNALARVRGRVVLRRGVPVTNLALGPEGRWLFVWPGRQLLQDLHRGVERQLRWPWGDVHTDLRSSENGRWVVAWPSGRADLIQLFDLAATDPIAAARTFRIPGGEPAFELAVGHSGRWLATVVRDRIRLWGLSADEVLSPAAELQADGAISAPTFSPDDRWLVFTTSNGSRYLWSLGTVPLAAPELLSRLQRFDLASPYAFSPDGRWLVTSSEESLFLQETRGPGPPGPPSAWLHLGFRPELLEFDPSGQRLAVTGPHGTVRVWRLAGDPLIPRDPVRLEVPLSSSYGGVVRLLFAPSGHWLAAMATERNLFVWDLASAADGVPPEVLHGHEGEVRSATFTPDEHLLTGGQDGTVRRWDLDLTTDWPEMLRLPRRPTDTTLRIAPTGDWLAVGSKEGLPQLWHRASASSGWRSRGRIRVGGWVTALVFRNDGRVLAAGNDVGKVQLWQLGPGGQLSGRQLPGPHSLAVLDFAFDASGSRLASVGWDGSARVWDLDDEGAAPIVLPHPGKKSIPIGVGLSDDGRWLATRGMDLSTTLWDLSFRPPKSLRLPPGRRNVERHLGKALFLPGPRLVLSPEGQNLQIWDLSRGKVEPPLELENPDGISLTGAVAGPEGRWLAAGGTDGSVLLWDLASPSAPPRSLYAHATAVDGLHFEHNGHRLAPSARSPMSMSFRKMGRCPSRSCCAIPAKGARWRASPRTVRWWRASMEVASRSGPWTSMSSSTGPAGPPGGA